MKKVCFFDLPFVRQDCNAPPEHNYRRIIAGDKVFYTFTSQFSDDAVLKKLKEGDRIYIGARPLAGGSYWLHWLVSPEHGNLEPEMKSSGNLRGLRNLVIALVLMIFSVITFFQPLNNTFIGVSMIFVFTGGIWMLAIAVQGLMVANSRAMNHLLKGLTQVKARNTAVCRQAEYLLTDAFVNVKHKRRWPADDRFNELDSVQPEDYRYAEELTLTGVQGKVSNLGSFRGFTGSGKSRRDYIEYQFLCGGLPFVLRSYYNSLTEDMNPLFFRRHPLFIADNDPVALTVNQQKGTIIGMYNERDHSAYLKPEGMVVSSRHLKMIYTVFAGTFVVMLLMILSIEINDLMSVSGTPDKWDWRNAAKSLGVGMMMFIMIFSGLMLIIEVIALLTRKYSAASVRFVFTRQMLAQARQRNGKDPFVQEVN